MLRVGPLPSEALNENVDGRQACGPLQRFGSVWQKNYRVELAGVDVTPEQVITRWKDKFATYWPSYLQFHAPQTGIEPGAVVVLNGAVHGVRLPVATGIQVVYADERSFSYISVQGHVLAGLITFSADRPDPFSTRTVVTIDVILGGQSPLSSMALALGGLRMEDRIWQHTLRTLAADHGVFAEPTTTVECLDRRWQWRHWRNLRHDALLAPLRHAVQRHRR